MEQKPTNTKRTVEGRRRVREQTDQTFRLLDEKERDLRVQKTERLRQQRTLAQAHEKAPTDKQ